MLHRAALREKERRTPLHVVGYVVYVDYYNEPSFRLVIPLFLWQTPLTVQICSNDGDTPTCRHVALMRAMEPAMQQWYGQAVPSTAPVSVPMSAGAPSGIKRPVMGQPVSTIDNALDDADRRLGAAYRALADAHEQSDERAVLLRQVDSLEREIAALHSQAIRYAA